MIVPNKWFRASYGERLRRHMATRASPVEIVDFGHAPLFPDADTFPCVAVVEIPRDEVVGERTVKVCTVPREEIEGLDLPRFVASRSHALPVARLRPEGWDLANVAVADLLEKIRRAGPALREYVGSAPLYGIKTGLNEAFLIDQGTRDRLVAEDPECEPIIERFLRGRDIQRWHPEWDGQWIIVLKSSENADWPWANIGRKAEVTFGETYPSVHRWLKRFEDRLRQREDQGRHWWELRSCDYYEIFHAPKLVYQDIAFHSAFALDGEGLLTNDTCFFLRKADPFVLAVLNSSVMWWYLSRVVIYGKDEAFRTKSIYMEKLPVPNPRRAGRGEIERRSAQLVELTAATQQQRREYRDDLGRALGAFKVSEKLASFWQLNSRTAETELRRCAEAKPTVASLARAIALHDKHVTAIGPVLRKVAQYEIQLQELIVSLYGLDAADVQLLRSTAPPRDPLTLAEEQLARLRTSDSGAREAG